MTWRIRIFSDFCTSQVASDSYIICCDASTNPLYGSDKDFVFVNDDTYTHAILLNKAMPTLTIPKSNVIGLAQEPLPFLGLTNEFIEYCKKHVHKYYLGDKGDLPDPFIESNSYIYFDRPFEDTAKPKPMSIMVSQKTNAPGHVYRHKLVQRILQTKLPIDIWGRGCYMYTNTNDSRLKGNFSKYEPYQGYMFHIAIENFETNHYFSEKIINPLLLGTIPIYMGCKNIQTYFPDQYIKLTGNIDIDMNLLEMICTMPSFYHLKIDNTLVNNAVNIIQNMKQLFA